jgi:hypothetical protein
VSTHRTLASLAVTGFLLGLIVHLMTFLPGGTVITDKHPVFWLLHIGVFAVCLPLVSSLMKPGGLRGLLLLPWWAYLLLIVAWCYAGFNFASVFGLLQAGAPQIKDGQLVLLKHGDVVRTLTAEQYGMMRSYGARAFSGHWMFFYVVAAVYFLFAPPTPTNQNASARPPAVPE